ncbi:MAG: hypothetical protein R3D58_02450 [Saprospiraceae bacterium]|nr:hypothetical protein [Lewinellaceae bacterium]
MQGRLPTDEFYERYVAKPSEEYRQAIGPADHLDAEAFVQFVARLKDFRKLYPNIAFWQIIDFKTLQVIHSDGELELFGRPLVTFKDIFRFMHSDYLLPYLHWRTAAFELIYAQKVAPDPLNVAYRFSIPLKTRGDDFFWFTMNSTIVQIDQQGRIVTMLQTFYQESKWSPRNLRPVEASLTIRSAGQSDIENQIITQLSLQLIDEFTNAELDLLALYASGKTNDKIQEAKSWSRHTLHEYNANLLRKAKKLFVYDFRSARSFAEYCAEKGYIKFT